MTPPDVFPLSDADREALPALHDMFRRFWSGPLAQAAPRVAYDAFFAATPPRAGVALHPSTDPSLPGWVCVPEQAVGDQALLYLHGGAYVMGTTPAYRGFVSQIAARTRRTIFILEYPLAPETALPAAIGLAAGAVERLRERYGTVGVIGDSAGGGLTLATLAQTGKAAAAVVFSPWTDLTFGGASLRERAASERLLDESALRAAARGYLGGAAADDPRASPLFGIPDALPPLLVQVGADEILYDDARRYAERAHARGHDVTLQEWTGMPHVFQQNVEQLEAARHALDLAAAFLERHMARRG
ncbi:alpha/beta hydrolase [Burkholderia sp. SFA1]|uniref:alpha/beta hydrolase fold domain-containing protein n=1 Tax=Caballeronia sp. CLC5 TaxID=2906764 RepID=UPI001F35AA4F|nr:alpha/beta hydrolase fold domain-containing protein [Caballeronia sp. CLC5]MCE4574300.1 alpha/beta hydrolase [Caballeronia sp. CLC5]BBP99683.1 alpha/beta hydrolase [Burkholderia sp. SFA1]